MKLLEYKDTETTTLNKTMSLYPTEFEEVLALLVGIGEQHQLSWEWRGCECVLRLNYKPLITVPHQLDTLPRE